MGDNLAGVRVLGEAGVGIIVLLLARSLLHALDELGEVDLAILVEISLLDHLLEVVLRLAGARRKIKGCEEGESRRGENNIKTRRKIRR